jgi:hypothetical protein
MILTRDELVDRISKLYLAQLVANIDEKQTAADEAVEFAEKVLDLIDQLDTKS